MEENQGSLAVPPPAASQFIEVLAANLEMGGSSGTRSLFFSSPLCLPGESFCRCRQLGPDRRNLTPAEFLCVL